MTEQEFFITVLFSVTSMAVVFVIVIPIVGISVWLGIKDSL